ncbi:hypothetical protein Airi01_090220 [Actinoallomurus iriomotensis]|uniref:Uncharacterized protein n=1 Tax=Actinoallomurus iriomotensis TaxID=478107 RepID=A0A9W6RVP0_9ACTN|nr:hypothetical protein Airi01_090220 [Actinoallomurus iriomotensis]
MPALGQAGTADSRPRPGEDVTGEQGCGSACAPSSDRATYLSRFLTVTSANPRGRAQMEPEKVSQRDGEPVS